MSIEAMKQAFAYIKANAETRDEHEIADALRQAIEQAEKQEPVAVVNSTISGHIDWLCVVFPKQGTKLYTTPLNPLDSIKSSNTLDAQPQRCINCESLEQQNTWLDQKLAEFEKREWVGLTDEEVNELWNWVFYSHNEAPQTPISFAKAVEAKLRSKNT